MMAIMATAGYLKSLKIFNNSVIAVCEDLIDILTYFPGYAINLRKSFAIFSGIDISALSESSNFNPAFTIHN
jgi:hypothetical protein